MTDPRPRFLPVVATGLGAAALAAVAGNQAWATLDDGSGTEVARASALLTDATAPPVTALALVVLAAWGVVLVSRGLARRAVTWLGLLAALGLVGFAVGAWVSTAGDLAADTSGAAEASRTLWSHVGVVSAVVALAAGAVATRAVRSWPEMGRRYDAPGDGVSAPAEATPPEEQSNLDLWRAIDEGHDPTAGPTH